MPWFDFSWHSTISLNHIKYSHIWRCNNANFSQSMRFEAQHDFSVRSYQLNHWWSNVFSMSQTGSWWLKQKKKKTATSFRLPGRHIYTSDYQIKHCSTPTAPLGPAGTLSQAWSGWLATDVVDTYDATNRYKITGVWERHSLKGHCSHMICESRLGQIHGCPLKCNAWDIPTQSS